MDVSTLLAESEWIGGLAARLVRDSHQAEDLAQETRLAALGSAPLASGDDERSLRPWLATVARNGARMLRRSEGSRLSRETERATEEGGQEAASPDALVARAETQELLLRLVRELPPELCDVILASFFDDRSPSEIARTRGLAPGTVRWRKSEGLKRLRERLDTHFDGDRSAWLAALLPLVPSHLKGAAVATTGGASFGGLLTTWTLMSLTLKTVVLTFLAGLVLFGISAARGPAETPTELTASGPSIAAAQSEDATTSPNLPTEVEIVRPVAGRTPATPAQAAPEDTASTTTAPETITRVQIRIMDATGRPVAGARVTPSLSPEMEDAHRADFEALDAGVLAALLAGLVRTSDGAGLVQWKTDLLHEGGIITFRAVGPHQATGELLCSVEAGGSTDAGDLVLSPAGAVIGTVRLKDGTSPPKQMVFLVAADSPLLEGEQNPFGLLGNPAVAGSDHIDRHGAFRLDGVPAGKYVVMTSRLSGFAPVRSKPFVVVPGVEGVPIELVLEEPALGRPQVLVLDADGSPLSGATVKLVGPSLSFEGSTNAEGTYSLSTYYERFAGGRLEVQDNTLLHRSQVLDPIPVEPQTLTVRMELAPTIARTLKLRNEGGEAPSEHRITVTGPAGRNIVAGRGAAAALVLPSGPGETFSVKIYAPGFRVEQLEGLRAADLPDSWSVALSALPGVSGQVTFEGQPVAGAKVALHGHITEGRVVVSGSHVSLRGSDVHSVRTDAQGRFRVHLTDDDDYVLAVSARRRADASLHLPDLRADTGRQNLEITLDGGGELEGVARDLNGQPLAGASVVLSHPYHDLMRKRSRKDGSFRFSRVPAGEWYVHIVREFDSGFLTQHKALPEGWAFPANCSIASGMTAQFDPVARGERETVVSGAWQADGFDVGAWSMGLSVGGWSADGLDPFVESWSDKTELDTDGRYTISAAAGREHDMTATAPGLGAPFRRTVNADELPLVLDTGVGIARLSLTGANEATRLNITWNEGPWSYRQSIQCGTDGTFAPTLVPSGTLDLVWGSTGIEGVTSLALELAPGEERSVDLTD